MFSQIIFLLAIVDIRNAPFYEVGILFKILLAKTGSNHKGIE